MHKAKEVLKCLHSQKDYLTTMQSMTIISIRIQDNMTIIQVSALRTDTEEKVTEFYVQIQIEIDRICKQSMLFVVGDWNSKVGNIKEKKVIVSSRRLK